MDTLIEFALFALLGITPVVTRSLGIGIDKGGRVTAGGYAIYCIPAALLIAFYSMH